MLDIKDLSLLKITKVRDYAIFFDYDGKHYFLHGTSDGYESLQKLYERHLDNNGFCTLKCIKYDFGSEEVANEYIKSISRNSIVCNQIDKKYFRDKLIKHKFIEGELKENDKTENKIAAELLDNYKDKLFAVEFISDEESEMLYRIFDKWRKLAEEYTKILDETSVSEEK